jgi:hypothetical protein
MVNCCEFGYTLQATAMDLVIRYGPLSGMKLIVKICKDFRTMAHSARISYALWAIAHDLVMRYGS